MLLSFSLIRPQTADAQDSPADADADALHYRIMEASGFDHALTDVWLSMEQTITETNVDPEQRTMLHRWLSAAFNDEVLKQDFSTLLRQNLDVDQAAAVIRFLESPSGSAILETEEQQVNATDDELLDFSESFNPRSSRNAARVRLVEDIAEGTRTFENTVLILHSIYANVMRAVQAVNVAEDRRMGEEDFQYTSALIRTQIENQMRDYVRLNMLFTYRDTEISDLENYAAHLNSPAGLWYTETLHNILSEVLVNAENRLTAVMNTSHKTD